MTGAACFRLRPDGIDLFVRLTPKAAIDRIEGLEVTADNRSHLKARVRAVPENGAANVALEKMVAKALGLPASSVSVSAGGTARLKVLRIGGDPVLLEKAISALTANRSARHASTATTQTQSPALTRPGK